MLEKCGNKKYSSSEPETYFSCNLSMHVPVHDDVLCAYAFGTGISLGLPHCSRYHKGIALVVPEDQKLQRDLVELNHDSLTAAHPGINKTHKLLLKQYWWPRCKEFVQQYMKGCMICQANKPITHQNNPSLHPITPQEEVLPFQTIAINFIIKLPASEGYDLIMTVTNHDCTKVVIL